MKKHFYSHLFDFEPLRVQLIALELTEDEQNELLEIAEDTLHHSIVDLILSELSEDDKQKFMRLLLQEEHDEIWTHLNERIENIESKIIDTAEKLQEELHADVHDLNHN